MKEPKREDYINGTVALTPCVEYSKALEKYIAYLKDEIQAQKTALSAVAITTGICNKYSKKRDRPTITEDRLVSIIMHTLANEGITIHVSRAESLATSILKELNA